MTMKEKFIAALTKRGEMQVKETYKFVVFSRREGGNYYIGRSGALRIGRTVASSATCNAKYKHQLLLEGSNV